MALLVKIIKNRSGETRTIFNRDIEDNDEYDIPSNIWMDLTSNQSIIDGITNGDYIMNNGAIDLSASEGLEHLNKFQQETSNFAYHSILNGESIIIPERQHMYTSDIDIEGTLEVAGRLILIEE